MFKGFQNHVTEYARNRTIEIENEVLQNNRQFQKLFEQAGVIQNKIREQLPPEGQDLLYQYEMLQIEQRMITHEVIYQQGLRDGMKFKAIFDFCRRLVKGSFRIRPKDDH